MTTTDFIAADNASTRASRPADHRGSWIPNGSMIRTRLMELRKRRGLMATLIVVNIGVPTLYLAIRLIEHAVAPKTYGPAGGYDTYTGLVAFVMYVFGFIVAATLGCAAGSTDLSDGMFRHLVVTGRSRLALYLARIPAGLAIVVPIVAAGFAIVCFVCALAAPTSLNYDGALSVPAGLSKPALVTWAEHHATEVVGCFNSNLPIAIPCPGQSGPNGPGQGPGGVVIKGGPGGQNAGPNTNPTPSQLRSAAATIAREDYADYSTNFLTPSVSLMIKSGLWLELEAIIGFIVGLGLASLLGQRTIAVVLMIILEVVVTPLVARARLPHLSNLQRVDVGLATAHVEPGGLPAAFGGGGGSAVHSMLLPESTTVAVCVIVAWLVGWTALGAWRMVTRDA